MNEEWTRLQWRQAVLEALAVTDPAQALWLEEHPQRAAIVAELTNDVYEMWLQAMTARETLAGSSGCEWTWMAIDEIRATVIIRNLESRDMWSEIDESHLRPIPINEYSQPGGPIPLQLIPRSRSGDRTRQGSLPVH